MGLFFGPEDNDNKIEQNLVNENALLEAYIFDEVSRLPDDRRKEFVESQEAKEMLEAGIIGRKTLVRLSKVDDIERRIGMASLQMAKDSNDFLYDQLLKVRVKERELLDKIDNKYSSKAVRVAKVGQRDYLKTKLPSTFLRK